jgi:hypothetical protein
MKARRILWLYCVFACLMLIVLLVTTSISAEPLRAASSAASEEARDKTSAAEAQGERVAQMEEEQRAHRADLTAEDAIRYSAEVQTEQAKLDDLNTRRDAAETTYAAKSQAYRNHMGRLIPIIALLILHIVGTMLFWLRKA